MYALFSGYKRNTYRPTIDSFNSNVLADELATKWKTQNIEVGPVLERGATLPSGNNLVDYIDVLGFFNSVNFMQGPLKLKYFPTHWILVQKEAALKNVEVGCKRFFSLYGCVPAPRRTHLGVRTYERIALLASIAKSLCW